MTPAFRFFRPLLAIYALSVGAAERTPWTASRLSGSPEPPLPFRVERAFPQLTFVNPLDAVAVPGGRRLLIVEQRGKIWSIDTTDQNTASRDLFIDLKEFESEAVECYGVAFHPKFAENRAVFVWVNLDGKGKPNREDGTRIARFRMAEGSPPRLDAKSGEYIFSWLSGGHNGGNLRFGSDGMLYISTGDAESPDPPDGRNTGQDISDLLASVLRIDVDRAEPGKKYAVPSDNPFVNTPGARGEVWAYGFRNPWRLSFDPRKGDLWVADVGWELWEMVYRVERGGNYGWSITEGGKQDIRPNGARGPTPILPPVVVHSHNEAASITGGDVYYGAKFPELSGAYIYGDWQFGTFWSLKTDRSQVVENRELCRSPLMPAGFGILPDGELIICDHGAGGLWRLERNPDAGKTSNFPRKLSETGIFADTPAQKPSPGVLPYQVNATRWADHATSERWIGLPGGSPIGVARTEWGVVGRGRWTFPKDTAIALTYSMEMERGNPASRRKLETQVMHFDGLLWGAYSYRWNDAQTDAELVGSKGEEIPLEVKDADAPGGMRRQSWKIFSRAECLRCHTIWNNYTPGFNGVQLKKEFLEDLISARSDARPLANSHDASGDLESRGRSYLHVNCSVCHRVAGGGAVRSFMNIEERLANSRLIDEKPVAGSLGLPEARVMAAGDPIRSVLLYRMTTAGRGHMPYLGGKLVDDEGIRLVRDWIASMPAKEKIPESVKSLREAESQRLAEYAAGKAEVLDSLLATPTGAFQIALAVIDGTLKGKQRDDAIQKGSALADPLRRDLFERFLPPEQRRKILGPNFDAAQLLARKGDPVKGKALFGALCSSCHRIDDSGAEFGPDLGKIAAKYDPPRLLEQIVQPGKVIDPEWNVTNVTFKDDETLAGFLAERGESSITLKLPGGERRAIPQSEIKAITTVRATLMPEGLLENLAANEAADLIEFLNSRK